MKETSKGHPHALLGGSSDHGENWQTCNKGLASQLGSSESCRGVRAVASATLIIEELF